MRNRFKLKPWLVLFVIILFLTLVEASIQKPSSSNISPPSSSATTSLSEVSEVGMVETNNPPSSPKPTLLSDEPSERALAAASGFAALADEELHIEIVKKYSDSGDFSEAVKNIAFILDNDQKLLELIEAELSPLVLPTNAFVSDDDLDKDYSHIGNSYSHGNDKTYYYDENDSNTYDILGQKKHINVYGGSSSYTKIGNTLFGSDGDSYTQLGNTTYGSEGDSFTKIGNTVYGSDNTSYTKIGNFTYGNDGSSYYTIGNTTYGNDGSSMTSIGNTTYLNY